MKTSRQTPAPGRGGPGIPAAQDVGRAAQSSRPRPLPLRREPAPLPRAAPPRPARLREIEPAAPAAGALPRSPSLQVGGTRGCTPAPASRAPHCARGSAPHLRAQTLWSPALGPTWFVAQAAAAEAAGPQARGRRRHHVSHPGWRGRSGPGPAPRARAHTSGAAGARPHPRLAQPGPGHPGARRCRPLDRTMGPFWERMGKTRRLRRLSCQ